LDSPSPANVCFPPLESFTNRVSSIALVQARAVGDPWVFDGTGHYNLTLPNDRWALVHRKPYTFDNTKAHPLIIAFHGGGADAGNQEAISNLSNNSLTINGQDLVVIYPQGTVGATGTRSFNGAPYSATGIDDVRHFIRVSLPSI
jgi:poly(3-hydroxybutyrate) depolymerase